MTDAQIEAEIREFFREISRRKVYPGAGDSREIGGFIFATGHRYNNGYRLVVSRLGHPEFVVEGFARLRGDMPSVAVKMWKNYDTLWTLATVSNLE